MRDAGAGFGCSVGEFRRNLQRLSAPGKPRPLQHELGIRNELRERPTLPADSGPHQRAGPRLARDGAADDRPSRPPSSGFWAAVLADLKPIFKTKNPVIIYPASGTGAWEAALVNTLSPGDQRAHERDGLVRHAVAADGDEARLEARRFCPTDWRHGADPAAIEDRLERDREHAIKAVCVVHNETSTGVVSRIGEVRKAIDRARHPALLLVDTISSLGSVDFRMDEMRAST